MSSLVDPLLTFTRPSLGWCCWAPGNTCSKWEISLLLRTSTNCHIITMHVTFLPCYFFPIQCMLALLEGAPLEQCANLWPFHSIFIGTTTYVYPRLLYIPMCPISLIGRIPMPFQLSKMWCHHIRSDLTSTHSLMKRFLLLTDDITWISLQSYT